MDRRFASSDRGYKMTRAVCRIVPAAAWFLLFLAGSAAAQSWVAVGPPGGNVRALAADPADPDRVYLGTAGGTLYRSDDGGGTWERQDPGFPLTGCSLDEIVVDGRGTVFVGYWEVHGAGGGVARSTDRGRTFTLLDGIEGESVRALALAPSNERILAAGTLNGVFLSRDAGRNWKRISPRDHPDLRNVESLAFDPRDPRILYAGTWHLPWKTTDAGGKWVQVHRGMIDDSHVMTLTIDPANPGLLFATACTGIYRSRDAGRQWTKLQGIPYSARRTRAFARHPRDPHLVLAGTTEGLWVSADGGTSWRRSTPKELVVNALLVQPGGAILLGADGAGVLRSTDRGRNWEASNAGFSERFVSKLVFDPSGGRVLAAVWGDPYYGGVFQAESPRGVWSRVGKGMNGRQVSSLAVLGDTPLAGTDDGIFALVTRTGHWTRLNTHLDGREAHPRVTELIASPPRRLLASTSRGLMRSTDGGRSWSRPGLGKAEEISGLAVSPGDPDLVVAASRVGFFKSRDGGASWKQVAPALKSASPHALAFLPGNDRVLLLTTTRGLYRSEDQGESWSRVGGGIPASDLTGIAVHPDGRTVFVSDFASGGVFRSDDRGHTWERMPTEGLASDRVWTLGLDPAAPERLLAAPPTGGLHLLIPKGAT
jgi:photosystem II stability/assembly factor-like uncharacterized protein